jgi:energy-coupling factor transporter ATP-binding protein EcfA2
MSRPSSDRDVPGTLIGFEDVALGYRRRAVLSSLTFAVHENEFFGIVGANGSGKTTILRAMLGILVPLRGRIRYAGGATRRRFGYVPQRAFVDELFPLTALDIVLMGRYGLLPAGRGRAPGAGRWRRPPTPASGTWPPAAFATCRAVRSSACCSRAPSPPSRGCC